MNRTVLSGSIVLSSGRAVPIRVMLDIPDDANAVEKCEIENFSVKLHDLTPSDDRKTFADADRIAWVRALTPDQVVPLLDTIPSAHARTRAEDVVTVLRRETRTFRRLDDVRGAGEKVCAALRVAIDMSMA